MFGMSNATSEMHNTDAQFDFKGIKVYRFLFMNNHETGDMNKAQVERRGP